MRLIDEIHTAEPTWGYRTITFFLRRAHELVINKKRVRRIMRDMGIYALYPKPNLSRRYHAQYVRPYLLRNLSIVRPNQVWGVDITYVRMKKGFMYLFVIIDWYSRYIVDYELSSTIDKSFVLNCLKRALASHTPEIINSDQGGHFTNPDYIKLVEESGAKISMDGKGQCQNGTILPHPEIRSHLHQRIRDTQRTEKHAERIHGDLQCLPATFFTGRRLPGRLLPEEQAH
jgi:putative transposase